MSGRPTSADAAKRRFGLRREKVAALVDLDEAGEGDLLAALPERFLRPHRVLRQGADLEDRLARLHAGGLADRGAEGAAHALGDTVGAGAGRLLVLTEDVVRVGPHAEVEV